MKLKTVRYIHRPLPVVDEVNSFGEIPIEFDRPVGQLLHDLNIPVDRFFD